MSTGEAVTDENPALIGETLAAIASGVDDGAMVLVGDGSTEASVSDGERLEFVLPGTTGGGFVEISVLSGTGRSNAASFPVKDAEDGIQLTAAEVQDLVTRSALALDSPALAIAVVDRAGDPLAVYRRPAATQDAIENLMVPTTDGAKVPLKEIADTRTLTGPAFIYRDNNMRYIAVKFSVRGRDLGSTIKDGQQQVAAAVTLPQGYKTTWNGEFENQQRASGTLSRVVPLCLLVIFLILFITYGNVKDAVLTIMNVPFALIGGILALHVTGMNFSISAGIGFPLIRIDPSGRFLFLTNGFLPGGGTDSVRAYRVNANGSLTFLNSYLTNGSGSAAITVTRKLQ